MPGTPRYVEIADHLRHEARRAPAGTLLPSEPALAARFGVSRMTARQAVKAVQDEGLVYRVPGAGTYSSGTEAHRAPGELRSFTSEMGARGLAVSSDVLEAGWATAAPPDLAELGLPPGGRVVRVVRVRHAGGTPMALETAHLVPRCSFVLDHDLATASLHALLAGRGIVPTEASGTLRAVAATAQDAGRLDVAVGAPLLVERRRVDDQHGARVESTETRYVGDRYVFDVHLRRPPGP